MLTRKTKPKSDSILSREISSLLDKKVFSRSKYFNLGIKPPQNVFETPSKDIILHEKIIIKYIFCVLVLLVYFANIFKFDSKNRDKRYVLVFSLTNQQAIRNGSIKSLHTFLKSRNLINDSKFQVLIEVRKVLRSKNFEFTKSTVDIPLKIYADNFSIAKKLKCWIAMCSRFYKITSLLKSNNAISLIMKEYIFDEVVYQNFNLKHIDKLITTQSNHAYQPLIFEYANMKTKRIMIWYSSNSVPLNYNKVQPKRFMTNPVIYKNMQIDEHWVWTEKHKNYLKSFSDATILVKKSLMFYESERKDFFKNIFDVLIFDVTPKKDSEISDYSIYTVSEMIKFINDVLKCAEMIKARFGIEVKVGLKHKRGLSRHSSPDYSQFIRSKIKSQEINIVDPNQNIYDLIENSRLIIGFPFTSPVIIGQELNKPAVFYCSSDLLKPAPRSERHSFLQTQDSLYAYMKKALRS